MRLFICLPILLGLFTLLSMNYQRPELKQGNIIIEVENGKLTAVSDEIFVEKQPKRSKCLIVIPAVVITSLVAAGTVLVIHFTDN